MIVNFYEKFGYYFGVPVVVQKRARALFHLLSEGYTEKNFTHVMIAFDEAVEGSGVYYFWNEHDITNGVCVFIGEDLTEEVAQFHPLTETHVEEWKEESITINDFFDEKKKGHYEINNI